MLIRDAALENSVHLDKDHAFSDYPRRTRPTRALMLQEVIKVRLRGTTPNC